ncbi:MAG: ABC transporter ATP-binding protein [Gemmatimonadetes bacterium]|nr:ABC transporter ATP-binding protein [Gemmatimonadota bacterium]
MRRLLAYLRPYRGRVAVAVLLLLGGAAVEMAQPLLTRAVIDRAIPGHDPHLLLVLTTAYLGTLLLSFLFEYLQLLLTSWLGQHVMYDLRRQIFAHLQRLPLPYYDRNPVGRMMTRVTSDVEVLNELFSSGVVAVFGDLFALLFIVVTLFALDWQLAIVTLLVMPFVFAAATSFRRLVRDAYRDIRIRLARINAYLQERITGVTVVQLFGREQATVAEFRAINDFHLQAHLRSIRYYALFFPVIELLTAIAFALIITYGGWEVLRGSMSVGSVYAFLIYARRFFRPIQDLSEKYNMLQGAMASSERIFKLLDTPLAHAAGGEPVPASARGRIEFQGVWFAYRPLPEAGLGKDTWDWVLRDLSFAAEPGERVAVVGHTGAGKTTIISLLMRFYEPQQGRILLDGIDIRAYDVLALRRRIALVLQDVFIFSRDIAYNIRLGDERISDERIRAAAARVGADAFIERLPRGYAEPLGERGASLSVGERQLLSFARALAFDPLVLVLDEATSSVDSALEERIEQALDVLMAGRTSLVIAHRLSTIQHADRILVLHHGELREQGTHAELLRRGGLYARLYELQFAPLPPGPGDGRGAAGSSPGNGKSGATPSSPASAGTV